MRQHGHFHVFQHRQAWEQAAELAVLGQQRKAFLNGHVRVGDAHRLAIEADLAAAAGGNAKNGFRDVGTARAHQPGDTEDFARMQVEGDVLEHAIQGQVAYRQQQVTDRRLAHREQLAQFTAHHHRDEAVAVHAVGALQADVVTVAEHRNFIGDGEHFVHFVGDVDDAFALGFQVGNDRKQVGHFLVGNG